MSQADDLVELARFLFEHPAMALVAALRAAGIRAECLGSYLKNSNLYSALCIPVTVVVRREDLETAREFLGAAELPLDWEDEAERASADEHESDDPDTQA